MQHAERYCQRILQFYPERAIHTARLHTGDGQFNDILSVNEALVFRFPRTAHGARNVALETAVLCRL